MEGRRYVGEPIDHRVGLEMMVRINDPVQANQPLVRCYKTDVSDTKAVIDWLDEAFEISDSPIPSIPLFQSLTNPYNS